MDKLKFIIPGIVVLLFLFLSSIFVVDERQKALVLQFGQIKQVREEPGLYFKIPFIQEVVRYDDRILSLDTDVIEVTPSDDRRLVVDAFTRYRIRDVVQFRQAVGVGGVRTAEDRLSSILNAQIREVLGADQVTSNTILSEQRRELMSRIQQNAQASAEGLGLDVVDVRLKKTNLPDSSRPTCPTRTSTPPSPGCAPSVSARPPTRSPAVTRRRSACAHRPTGP